MNFDFGTYLKTNAGVTDEQFVQLEGITSSKTFAKGQFLSDKGQICKHSFFVENAVVLVLSGEPIDEPIATQGPFVMNTREELVQAIDDFNMGKFGFLEE